MFGPPDVKRLAARGKVDQLVRALVHDNPTIRRDAATALGQLRNPRAIEPLAAAGRDASLEVRDAAVWALGEIGPAALPPLLALLREGSDRASWALRAIGEPAVAPLLKVLTDGHERHVGLAIDTLGKIGDARAAAPIAAFLGSSAQEGRRAHEALVALGEPAVEHVVPLLRSAEPSRRWAAASTLRDLGWEPATEDERTALVLAGGDLSETGGDATYEHLSFDAQRHMAQRELARRGAPGYDVSAYAALTSG